MSYYVPYYEEYNINYIYLLLFYRMAVVDKNLWIKNTVNYRSLKDLAKRMNELYNCIRKESHNTAQEVQIISQSTISRISNNAEYSKYFEWQKDNKKIVLFNDFRNTTNSKKIPFVCLDEDVVSFLIEQNDNLLATYYLYLKYHCGSSKDKQTDTTAKQFLDALGYSTKSGSFVSRISEYNSLLVSKGLLKIKKYRDENGHERNIYSVLS